MFDTVVLATDGSASADRMVAVACDFAQQFDATLHALYVIDVTDVEGSPEQLRDEMHAALEAAGDEALAGIEARAGGEVVTAVREGRPVTEICQYAEEVDADLVATGTRGRHGEHSFLLGSVAEGVVRRCPRPVLTVRQLDDDPEEPETGAELEAGAGG